MTQLRFLWLFYGLTTASLWPVHGLLTYGLQSRSVNSGFGLPLTLHLALLFGLHLPCIYYAFTLHLTLHFGKKPSFGRFRPICPGFG